mmetsp:Transcript_3318/g.7319  ORF Transcript_3318/g.7319 Transcript_3318/m.7319 type:complete len:100 (+) Transcript_3318:1277-1576(+)
MTFGVVLTLNVVGELYVGSGGAYNVDSVLAVMVQGLDEELEVRMRDLKRDKSTAMNEWSTDEKRDLERRGATAFPSPSYYPMRHYTTLNGEDSVEVNSI